MALQIVTGYEGKAHVTAADDGAMQAGIFGTGKYVLNVGNKFAYTIVSNNSITIKDGSLINQGRHINIPYGETVSATITNGTQSKYRKDIIGIQYSKNTTTGIETVSLVVKKGTEATSESAAADPSYTTGNILQEATSDFFPLYRVTLNGLSISSVTPLFNVLVSMNELNTDITNLKGIKSRYIALSNQYIDAGYSKTVTSYIPEAVSGYARIPIYMGVSGTGSTYVTMTGMQIDGNTLSITARNHGTSAASGLTFVVYILFVPSF